MNNDNIIIIPIIILQSLYCYDFAWKITTFWAKLHLIQRKFTIVIIID